MGSVVPPDPGPGLLGGPLLHVLQGRLEPSERPVPGFTVSDLARGDPPGPGGQAVKHLGSEVSPVGEGHRRLPLIPHFLAPGLYAVRKPLSLIWSIKPNQEF